MLNLLSKLLYLVYLQRRYVNKKIFCSNLLSRRLTEIVSIFEVLKSKQATDLTIAVPSFSRTSQPRKEKEK